jgi:predicted RNA-binding Zn-ribbon protein involved in translation (DUF1610 family)
MKKKWQDIGETTFRFLAHEGQFPWPACGVTITDPEQARAWAKAAKPACTTRDRKWEPTAKPLGRFLPNCGSPIRATW